MPHDAGSNAPDDAHLVNATLQGDLSSFGIMVERYWHLVNALALSRIDNPVDAEDVAQETFLKAYSQLGKLRDPARFAGWISKIAGQQCINHIRKNARRPVVTDAAAEDAGTPAAAFACRGNPGLTEDQASFVRETVAGLPLKFRKVIIMRFVAGLSAAQIAKQLGKRHGTVRVWLHRAYRILRKDLAALLEEV